MPELVLLTGLLIVGVSLFLIIRARDMAGLLQTVFGTGWLYGVALLRLLLGAMLIGSARTVAFAPAVELLGWLFCVAGLTLVAVPRPVLDRLLGWYAGLSLPATRLWLGAALLVGLLLILACVA